MLIVIFTRMAYTSMIGWYTKRCFLLPIAKKKVHYFYNDNLRCSLLLQWQRAVKEV